VIDTFKPGDPVSFIQYNQSGIKSICYGEIVRMYAYPCTFLVMRWNGGAFIQHSSTLSRLSDSEAFLHKLESK